MSRASRLARRGAGLVCLDAVVVAVVGRPLGVIPLGGVGQLLARILGHLSARLFAAELLAELGGTGRAHLNTATAGNGGGIYIHFNAGNVSISNATITDNKASATGNTSYGHGGGIYSERGVTVKGVTITGNNSTYEGGGIYGKGAITLTDATVTDNSQYDVYYEGKESTTPELTVSGLVKAGYYANFDWKLPILVSGALNDDSVIRVGVRDGIKPNAGGSLLIAEPASGVTLRAENFKADAADSVTSLGEGGKVYLSLCDHVMDQTGYTCKKCGTTFDARVGESAYYQTLAKAFQNAWDGSTITLMRDVNLNGSCSASDTITLDLHGKTITSLSLIHI